MRAVPMSWLPSENRANPSGCGLGVRWETFAVGPACGFWDHIVNRFSKFPLLLSGECLERAGRRFLGSFLLDKVAVTLSDEDFPRGEAYTRSILLQGCAERAEAFLMLRQCADYVSLDACM